ncbi:MAG TPA: cupredoxin family copper-binding protein [Patescibacteria group bacterium]|nr:cupredoxin family copper-binding protein [Patescibacteria group bacterium]
MNKLALVVGLVILLVVGFFGYKCFYPTGMSSMTSSAPSNLEVPANTVIIQGNAFTPDALTVKVGTKITWTNNDSYAHTVTSNNGAFDSGNLASGQSFSFTFTKAGSYGYYCMVHPFMKAKIVVTN